MVKLDHLKEARHALILYRDGCLAAREVSLARRAEDVIDALNRFPELHAERRAALDEIIALGQECDSKERD